MKSFETPNGKKIELFRDPKTAHIKIQFTSGGELPEELTGFFTSEKDAEKSVLVYLDSKTKKEKTKNV